MEIRFKLSNDEVKRALTDHIRNKYPGICFGDSQADVQVEIDRSDVEYGDDEQVEVSANSVSIYVDNLC